MLDVLNKFEQALQDAETWKQALNTEQVIISRLGKIYPSYPLAIRQLFENGGLPATPFNTYSNMTASDLVDGSYAIVTNDSDPTKNGYYQKKAEGWQLSQYNPAMQLLDKIMQLDKGYNQVIHDSDGNKYPFAIVNDVLKKIAWGMSDTTMIAPNHRLEFDGELSGFSDSAGRSAISVRKNGSIQLGSLMLEQSDSGAISIQDQVGRAALHISPNGKVSIYDLQSPSLASTSSKPNLQVGWHRKDINHIIIYGQSLSDGSVSSTGEPSTGNEISTTQPYANIMLAGGTRSEPQHDFYSTEFAPLVEQSIGQFSDSSDKGTYNTSQNESPVAGTCNEFTRRCLANSQKAAATDFVMCGMASGRGGQSLENLTNGTQWTVIEQHIKDVANTAKSLDKTEAVSAIVYIQGEANHHAILRDLNSFDPSITADLYEYQQRVMQLINKIDDVAIANCPNQDYLPYVFTYQTEAHRSYDYPDTTQSLNENPIASAQWFMSRSNERFVLAIPAYALPKNDRDKVHLSHVGCWLMGAYMARAMEYTMHRKQGKWRPLEPTHYNWTDTHCDIEFYVPCGKLVLDDYFCPMQPNFGFDIWIDKELQTDAISTVTLLDNKTVRVSFAAPQPLNALYNKFL